VTYVMPGVAGVSASLIVIRQKNRYPTARRRIEYCIGVAVDEVRGSGTQLLSSQVRDHHVDGRRSVQGFPCSVGDGKTSDCTFNSWKTVVISKMLMDRLSAIWVVCGAVACGKNRTRTKCGVTYEEGRRKKEK
jgi:hypothetical protein